jgi:hypothetical protein
MYCNQGASNAPFLLKNPPQTDHYGDARTVSRTPIIDIKPSYGVSELREAVKTTSGGTLTAAPVTGTGEHLLQTTTSAASAISTTSAERGTYPAGYSGECGVAVRLPNASSIAAGAVARWGYYDGVNGLYYSYDTVNGLSVNILRSGVVTQITQANFDGDHVDSTGSSGLTLDMTRGNTFLITFAWYGYGSIIFSLVTSDPDSNQRLIPLHQFTVSSGTSICLPQQPIRVELFNTMATTTGSALCVSGRQYSIIGSLNISSRTTPIVQYGAQYAASGALTPVLAIRKKAGFTGVRCFLSSFDSVVPVYTMCLINNQCTVADGTWTAPSGVGANNTALEVNTTFTSTLATLGTQVHAVLNTGSLTSSAVNTMFTESDVLIISLQALSGLGIGKTTSLASVLRVREEW